MSAAKARLSVVVPVRDAAQWLAGCLDSLLAQTRPIDEIVVVENGSTDDSPKILADYAARYSNIKFVSVDSTGAAAARNVGIDLATGEWLAFVDADDWVEPGMYSCLLDLAERHDLDIAMCNGRYHFEGRSPDRPIYADPPFPGPVSGAEWLTHKLENKTFLHMVWMHLYRRSYIDRHGFRFVEGLMHEDVIWSTRALALAERVAYDDTAFYVYRKQLRPRGTEECDRRLRKTIDGAKTDARLLAEFADGLDNPRLARAIRWQLVDGALSVFHKIDQLSKVAERRRQLAAVRQGGFMGLLWRNATELRQRRKIVRRYLRSVIAGLRRA